MPTGTHSVVFCILLSLLSLFVLHASSSFSIIYVRHQEGWGRAVQDVIEPTPAVTTMLDGTAGQVGGGREEEVEGWGWGHMRGWADEGNGDEHGIGVI